MDDADRPRATRRKPSYAERRERRAAVEDVAEVLEAAARFLEARPRSVAEVRRRLTPLGYRRRSSRRDRADGRARLSRRRGVRARLGRVAGPGAAARRARAPAGAPAQGRGPVDRRRRSSRSAARKPRRGPAGHDGAVECGRPGRGATPATEARPDPARERPAQAQAACLRAARQERVRARRVLDGHEARARRPRRDGERCRSRSDETDLTDG